MTDSRQKPLDIRWGNDDLIGRIFIDGELWAAVEWSEKRQCWCIEDSQGACLRHTKHIQGGDKDKAAAIALAEAMIRDGRMPDPATALKNRQAEIEQNRQNREKRLQQPAEINKREEEDRVHKLLSDKCSAERSEQRETPFYEALADAFDFADPELWKSNSFASLRPRIVVSVKTAIAGFEYEIAEATLRSRKQPFASAGGRKERRQAAMRRSQEECAKTIAKFQSKLDRAHEILALLEPQ